MHTNHPKEDPLVELGYEHRDINFKNLTRAITYFFVFTAICFAAGFWVYDVMHPMSNRQTKTSETSYAKFKPKAPNPLLQDNITAKADIMTMRQSEYARLHSTGPIEGAPGKVHIPVERAMDLIVERGLPETPETSTPQIRGTTR